MQRFEGIMSGEQCSELLEPLADFLDTMRAFRCNVLAISQNADTGAPEAKVKFGTSEPALFNGPPVRQVMAAGIITCKYSRSWIKPPENRPLARKAVWALASVIRTLPPSIGISGAYSYFLDGTLSWAPMVELDCTGDQTAQDDFGGFLGIWPCQTDSQGNAEILTHYHNSSGKRIGVITSFVLRPDLEMGS